MNPIEGLTVIHVLAAAFGALLFLVALALLIRSAVKYNTYPKTLVICLVLGATLLVFPVTKKFEFSYAREDMKNLTAQLKRKPDDSAVKMQLKNKLEQVEDFSNLSPTTKEEINDARLLMREDQHRSLPHQLIPLKRLQH